MIHHKKRTLNFAALAFLFSLTLPQATSLATDVSGKQSGTWTLPNSPYYLIGDVTVPPGQTLTIEPGVQIIAQGHYAFTVDQSTLLAVGTPQQTISFTATNQTTGWRGLRLETSNDATTISNCIFEYAKGTGAYPGVRGGAMMVRNCSPTISHNLFRYNSSHNDNFNGCGGAICTESSSAIIFNNIMIDNMADSGGAIATTEYGTPKVRGNYMADNSALNGGGGMYLGARSSPLIEYNIITSNSSGGWGGGGINSWTSFIFYNTYPIIRNNLITYNTASRGGGLYCRYDRAVITNNTIAFNSASYGGGIHALNFPAQAPFVDNCVLWGNTASVQGAQVDLEASTGSAIWLTYCIVQGGWAGTGNVNANPSFIDPNGEDHMPGNEDDNFRVDPGSPCIDAGDNSVLPGEVQEDLDRNPRFVDDPDTKDTGSGTPPIVDIGAYEFQVPACPWDLDGNAAVGTNDLLILFSQWGTPGTADFDESGFVDTSDLLILFANWGPCK